jgi:hypothetical protein
MTLRATARFGWQQALELTQALHERRNGYSRFFTRLFCIHNQTLQRHGQYSRNQMAVFLLERSRSRQFPVDPRQSPMTV